MLRIALVTKDVAEVTKWSRCLVQRVPSTHTSRVTPRPSPPPASDTIVGYRAFVAVVVTAYFTLIALTPRTPMMPEVSWAELLPLSVVYLALGIWGFDYARRRGNVLISLA